MTEPRTAAGRALLDGLRQRNRNDDPLFYEGWFAALDAVDRVLADEAEAAELAVGLDAAWAEAEADVNRRRCGETRETGRSCSQALVR